MTFSAVRILPVRRILKYFGMNSLAVMVNHFYVLSAFGLILLFIGKRDFLFEEYYILQSIMYFAFYLVLSLPAIKIYNFIMLMMKQVFLPDGQQPILSKFIDFINFKN